MSITVFQDSIAQIWNKGDSSAIERFIAPTYFGVDPAEPEVIAGIEGYRQHFFRLTTAFPDAHITIDHIQPVELAGRNSLARPRNLF